MAIKPTSRLKKPSQCQVLQAHGPNGPRHPPLSIPGERPVNSQSHACLFARSLDDNACEAIAITKAEKNALYERQRVTTQGTNNLIHHPRFRNTDNRLPSHLRRYAFHTCEGIIPHKPGARPRRTNTCSWLALWTTVLFQKFLIVQRLSDSFPFSQPVQET